MWRAVKMTVVAKSLLGHPREARVISDSSLSFTVAAVGVQDPHSFL